MGRRPAIALCLAACSLLTASSSAAGAAAGPAPPTSRELERATERFLDSRRARVPDPAASATGTGGIGKPGGGGLFPQQRLVALYGAPQMTATIVGRKSVNNLRKQARKQARTYRGSGPEVVPGIDLVAAIATSDRGRDGKYRTRQPDDVIARYARAADQIGGRLMLDIQPGRSSFKKELRALREWIEMPDVDVALDPEWNVGRRGKPGRTTGRLKARELNEVSAYLNRIVRQEGLPDKALIVHQFRTGSVRQRDRVRARAGVDVTLSFDGIGGAAAKRAGYRRLTRDDLFAGFSLFYKLDRGLMKPAAVTRLEPPPNFVLYQ
jgi:hypothetical protein